MPKPDPAHRKTDDELAALEKRIAAVYKQAADEMQGKVDAYFQSFAKRYEEQKKKLAAGEITEAKFKAWVITQTERGSRLEDLAKKLAHRWTNARSAAAAYTNDATPGIYSLNRNYAAYTIEKQVGADIGFTMWDEQTVKRLIVEEPDLMPYYPPKKAFKRGIDLQWGKRQITVQVRNGILQGESIKQLSDKLQKTIPNMSRDSAIRAARTSVTSAQNAGRQDGYIQAEAMGIELEKEWVATLDARTRPEHADADGQTVPINEPFIVGGEELEHPGDPHGSPWNIYQCRCTMIARVKNVPDAVKRMAQKEIIPNMTFRQWEKLKSA